MTEAEATDAVGATPEQTTYDASAIQVLEGLEAVRKRPGMYIGSTGERGLHHLIWEIVDNAVDEALAGYCDTIKVTLREDGWVSVADNGRGIPTDTAAGQEIPAATLALTVLHAGGKFGGGGYKVSGGLHGVGSSVVNALSTNLHMEIKNRGRLWEQEFTRGVPDYDLREVRELEEGVQALDGDRVADLRALGVHQLRQHGRADAEHPREGRLAQRETVGQRVHAVAQGSAVERPLARTYLVLVVHVRKYYSVSSPGPVA